MSSAANLEPILRAVEPALRLVHERHLRQILYFLIDRGHPLPANPDLPFWFTRAELEAADVLPEGTLSGTEPRLLLITGPGDRLLAEAEPAEQLSAYWRLLLRAEVMNAIDAKCDLRELDAAKCRDRLNRFGPAAVREIRFVLESEHLLAAEAGDLETYRTFAAVSLDLDNFTAHGAEEFFPTLSDRALVRSVLDEDVAVESLVAASRPEGAVKPQPEPPPEEIWCAPPGETRPVDGLPPTGTVARALRRAAEAEQKGNLVRAAILRTQAAMASHGLERERAMEFALSAVRQLVERLGDVLEWDQDTREEWRQALGPMLPLAASGDWPRAARCLYELQRIPADLAREVYAVELPEYIRTFGRRPIRRHLPHARPVMVLMALRKAHQQLLRASLGALEQLRLDRLLHHELDRRAEAIRHTFTPIIVEALTAAGLVPANRVEEVAREKLVAELLDRVCVNGYLRISDLRDAVARNQLKLRDLRGVGEFVSGDSLLRADNALAYALDGVYRRGEFYLRWIQRFVSIFFGTPWGRALTLYVALPFGGAFLALMFAEELRHMGTKAASYVSRSLGQQPAKGPPAGAASTPDAPTLPPATQPAAQPPPAQPTWDYDDNSNVFEWESERNRQKLVKDVREILTSSASRQTPEKPHHGSVLIEWPTILGFGVFLLLVIHLPPFRRAVFSALRLVWRVIRGVLWEAPMAVWRSEPVRRVRLSRSARYLYRHFATPVMLSLIVIVILFLTGLSLRFLLWYGWLVLAGLVFVYNTRIVWEFQDRIAEALSEWWRRVRVNLLPGLIAGIIDAFRSLANWIERQLYAVDEWMRFRGGDSHGSIATKAVLGLIWFPIAYVTRFAFYLLVEPQVNPVKHFPVVTVSHKVIWPMVPQIAELFGVSPITVGMVVNGIPGIFGFIAWELKENWRLYEANRPARLNPVTIGSHGETMRGLLRPGFHSGTVPKIYRKARKALERGNRAKAAQLHHDLEHTAEGVYRFVERELLPLLMSRREWGGVAVEVAGVRFGVQQAEIVLTAHSLGGDPFVLALENINEVIEARIVANGWSDKLTDSQRGLFLFALRGLLDMSAAAKYDGRDRTPGAQPEPGTGLLIRPVPWEEWVEGWAVSEGGTG